MVINGHLLLTNDYTHQARHHRAVIELVSYHCINITTLAPPNNVLKLYLKHYQLLTPVFQTESQQLNLYDVRLQCDMATRWAPGQRTWVVCWWTLGLYVNSPLMSSL